MHSHAQASRLADEHPRRSPVDSAPLDDHLLDMSLAVRMEDVPALALLPTEFKAPPSFEPTGMSPELAEDLRRRSEIVRQIAPQVEAWAEHLRTVVDAVVEQFSLNTLLTTERYAINFAELENKAEKEYGFSLSDHKKLRAIVELLDPRHRAAWLGFLDPYIRILQILTTAPSEARRRVFQAIRDLAPGFYKDDFDERNTERLLNARAGYAYKTALGDELGLPCSYDHEIVGDEVLPVVYVHVPSEIERPHRAFADAEQRVHEMIERAMPEMSGRVIIRYVTAADAA